MTAINKFQKLDEKLKQKESKLSYLLEITNAINSNKSKEKLIENYEYILREQLDVAKALLYYKVDKTEWQCILKYGFKGKLKDIDVTRDLTHVKDITVIESSSKESIENFDVVIPVYHKTEPLAFLLLGDYDEQKLGVSPSISHMPFIQTLTNIIVVAIENKEFARKSRDQEQIKKELEVASEMQRMLLPRKLPNNERIEMAAQYLTHSNVGGDYYDYVEMSENEFCICIADVSGKGVSAALLMSNFQANLRAIVHYNRQSLHKIIKDLNKRVFETAEGEKFITAFIGMFNFQERTLKYVNAGHNPPLLTEPGGSKWLFAGCTGLGMFEQIPKIEEGLVQIPAGALLTLYTDGVVDLENDRKEHFETENLKEVFRDNFHQPVKVLHDILFRKLERFKGPIEYADDTAVFTIRFK